MNQALPAKRSPWAPLLLGLTAMGFAYHLIYIFAFTPEAQPEAGGIAQKILYFHAPAAYSLYLSGAVCMLGSAAYLARATNQRNAWAQAGSEAAVVFGLMVLVSGPLWAKKAWGVYWTWDPRLTTLLLSVLVYSAITLLRRFTGDGDAERKFAAALGVLGTVLLPIIHYSVKLWRGNHPTVIGKGGGGLGSSQMLHALLVGFVTMTLLALLLLWTRKHLILAESRLRDAEELATTFADDHEDEDENP